MTNVIVARVRNILLSPKREWPAIDAEPATPRSLFVGYVMVLAAIAPILAAAMSLGAAIVAAIVHYALALAMTLALAFIADRLSPSFGGSRDFVRSLKLVAYSGTPIWVLGAVSALVPVVAPLLMLAALLYALYTFHAGASALARASPQKATGYTIVVGLCGIVIAAIVATILGRAALAPSFISGPTWV